MSPHDHSHAHQVDTTVTGNVHIVTVKRETQDGKNQSGHGYEGGQEIPEMQELNIQVTVVKLIEMSAYPT